DSDGDALSDGLELGWGSAIPDTNTSTDTNGDGVPNFQPDLDPPVYNTTDNRTDSDHGGTPPANYSYFNPWTYDLSRSRPDLIAGTVKDPTRPDTDSDNINDGLEDRTYSITGSGNQQVIIPVHNGRVDILPNAVEAENVISHPPTVYNTSEIN